MVHRPGLGTIVLIGVLTALATASESVGVELTIVIAKAAGFLVLCLVVGSRVVPSVFEFRQRCPRPRGRLVSRWRTVG